MKKLKYILSNSGKFHHFEVAKILHKRNQLSKIICGYPWFKVKNEKIPKNLVETQGIYNILKYPIRNNSFFSKISDNLNKLNKNNIDNITSNYIDKNNNVDVLLALAGVSFESGLKMLEKKNIYICERSSAHIGYQNDLLVDEYKELRIEKKFVTNKYFIEREISEYENADIILVPSTFAKNTFHKNYFNKIKVLGFGSDNENFYPIKDINKSDKYFDVLFIGQKSIRKGLHYLIRAFNKFKHPKKRLHIIGSDTNDKHYFSNKLNQDDIIIYGHVPLNKLNEIINKCHIFVLPSVEDGYGIVVSQAAAAGCPSIVSKNTGAADFVLQNNSGIVVPTGNSDEISSNLQLLADNKNYLGELSLNAVNGAKKYTWFDYVNKLDELILEFKTNKI